MGGSTLVASISAGGLPRTRVIDTGATRSIICEDAAGCIPCVIRTEPKCYSIRMADGMSQGSQRTITEKVKIGDSAVDLELLVVKRSVEHLILGMDFLAKVGAVVIVVGSTVKVGCPNGAPTAGTKTPSADATKIPHSVVPPSLAAARPVLSHTLNEDITTQHPDPTVSATHRRSTLSELVSGSVSYGLGIYNLAIGNNGPFFLDPNVGT
uniref:Peptidase A2 domain-containing protein n=1 Tax=Glossina palpalis gambiensis TaxID=67801 RepID=A0A1B0BSQ5_9MUSC